MGGKVAGFVFTVFLPVVVAAMLPHIGLEYGLPIILVSVVLGLSDFAWMYSKARHGEPKRMLILGMALGAIILGGCTIAFFLTQRAQVVAANPFDQTIGFSCDFSMRPQNFREDRPTYVLQIIGPPTKAADARFLVGDTSFIQGTGSINWTDTPAVEFQKCTITNYGKQPVFGVQIPLEVVWQEVVKTETGSTNGKTLDATPAMSHPIDLGISPRNEDYFYIASYAQSYVYVKFPDTAIVRSGQSEKMQTVRLIAPNSIAPGMLFVPKPESDSVPAKK